MTAPAISPAARARSPWVRAPRPSALRRATVEVHRAEGVTRVGDEARSELPFASLWSDVVRLYRTGLHPAVALHVSHRGRVVLDRSIGHVENAPGGRVHSVVGPDTLFNLFSASKIVTSALVHALVEDGLLGLDDPVADVIPEIGRHGKERIALRHLLSHTAGIPSMPGGLDVAATLLRGRLPIDVLAELRPVSEPGTKVAYHPMTSWFLIQELIERMTGRGLREVLRQRILDPLGFRHLDYGVPEALVGRVARHAVTGPPTPGLMARIFQRTVGVDLDTAVRITNEPSFLTAVLPSANVIGTPAEVTRFLEMLRRGGELDGIRVMSRRTVERMTTAATPRRFDGTFGFPMRYGLGVMMGGRRFSLFGLNTAGAFGHLGLSTVVVFSDPARELSVTFMNTGKPMMDPGMVRWYQVLQRLASMVPKTG